MKFKFKEDTTRTHLFSAACYRCVFVDAGVAPIDIETKRMKEEMKLKDAQAKAIAEHGELALITVDGPQTVTQERITLRPPMLQVDSYSLSLYVDPWLQY